MPTTSRQALFISLGLLVLILLGFTSCATRPHQVRHLASDISLVTPGTPAQEVRAIMGPPDFHRSGVNGEEWIYLEHHQSRMKRVRWFGDWLGHESFHLVIVTLRDNVAQTAVYRSLTAREFREFALGAPALTPPTLTP